MQATTKKEPLQIRVQCKHCQRIQNYQGQIKCKHCGKSGSLQLLRR